MFAALDAEETGLNGSQAFLKDAPVARDAIVMNVNLDMVARDAKNVLFAVRHLTLSVPQVVPQGRCATSGSPAAWPRQAERERRG